MESAMRTMEMKRTMTYSTMPKVPAPAMVYGPDYAGVRNEQPVSSHLVWKTEPGPRDWGTLNFDALYLNFFPPLFGRGKSLEADFSFVLQRPVQPMMMRQSDEEMGLRGGGAGVSWIYPLPV